MVVGVLAIVLNGAACLYGAWCWRRAEPSRGFWRLLRLAQAVVVLEVALGGVLLIMGRKAPNLHYLYGVLPLLVAIIAEPLRASSAQMVLDARGLESSQAVAELPDDQQRAIVLSIIQRELAVATLAALVVVVLLARAAMTAG